MVRAWFCITVLSVLALPIAAQPANGRNVNIASYNVKAGDEVNVKDKPKSRQLALRNLELTQIAPVPDWLVANRDALSGKVSRIPTRDEMQPMVNEQLIVELYSR